MSVLLMAIMSGSLLSAQASGTQPAPPIVRLTPDQIDGLIEQLAHPRFSTRERATQELCELTEADLPLLVDRYRRLENRFEVKRRIRYIAEYIFHRGQMTGRNGFMGVQVHEIVMPDVLDPATGQSARGVLVRRVIPGFAAERAGLKDYDLIVALNDQGLPEDPSTRSFVQKVGSHPPGSMIKLRVLRAAESRSVRVKLGAEPGQLLAGARLSVLTLASDAPAQGVWIMGLEDKSPAAAAGLKPNDIIRGIDGVPVGASGASQIEASLQALGPGSQATFEVASTRMLTVEIRLGSRPPELNDAKDIDEARKRFMAWWQDQGGDLPARPPDPSGLRVVIGFNVTAPQRLGPESSLLP